MPYMRKPARVDLWQYTRRALQFTTVGASPVSILLSAVRELRAVSAAGGGMPGRSVRVSGTMNLFWFAGMAISSAVLSTLSIAEDEFRLFCEPCRYGYDEEVVELPAK